MPTLAERITLQLAVQTAERKRLEESHVEQLAEIDERIALLQGAAKLMSKELEAAYVAMVKLKLINEV